MTAAIHAFQLLTGGFALALMAWLVVSGYTVIDRYLHDRRERQLIDIARALTDRTVSALPPLERSPAIRRALAGLSRRAVYRLVASEDFPVWVTELIAAYSLDQWGLERMIEDASPVASGSRWRRVSALFALGHIRPGIEHTLLRAAALDPGREVASAAVVVLHRLADHEAAEILIEALRKSSLPQSRIATHLDQFPLPIDDLLRPLLKDRDASMRYWAASLLFRYPNADGIARDVAAVVNDPEPTVRKAALVALGVMDRDIALNAARPKLEDPIPYVRSAAVRALARHGAQGDDAGRSELASWIAPLLADRTWEVRLAAKEGLVQLGPAVWRTVAAQLESTDAFARNGAAEVLQNLGTLDGTIAAIGQDAEQSAEFMRVLTTALREGGPVLVDAAVARSTPASLPVIQKLAAELRFVGAPT